MLASMRGLTEEKPPAIARQEISPGRNLAGRANFIDKAVIVEQRDAKKRLCAPRIAASGNR